MSEKKENVNAELKADNTQKGEAAAKAVKKAEEKKKKEKVKRKSTKGRIGRIFAYLIAIVLILVITDPSIMVFLPEGLAETLSEAAESVFGDAGRIVEMIKVEWIVIFQLGMMVVLLLLINEIFGWLFEKMNPAGARAKTLKNVAASTIKYLIALVGIFWGMFIIGVNVSTLFASVGVLALIIGFGAESLIADVITGLFVIFENQYNVGDIIELDGYRGTVVNIAIRTTSIMDNGGNVKIFNNSDVRNIINLSNEGSFAVCDIPVSYEVNLDEVEKVIESIGADLVHDFPEIFNKEPHCIGVQQLTDKAVILRVSALVSEENRFNAARIMNKRLKIGMENAGMGVLHGK